MSEKKKETLKNVVKKFNLQIWPIPGQQGPCASIGALLLLPHL